MDTAALVSIAVAVIVGPLTAVVAGRAGNRKTRREVGEKVESVHEEVRTNHGRRAGDYIELIPTLVEGQHLHARQLADHTRLDDERFRELTTTLESWYEDEPQGASGG